MEQDKFIEELRSLEAFFEKELSIEQMIDWYKELKDVSIERMRMGIREAKRTCKFFPKLAEFLNLINEVKVEKSEKKRIDCKKCGGTGYITYIKKILDGARVIPYTYALVCSCGNEQKYDGTLIKDEEHRSKFYTQLESELPKSEYQEIRKDNVFLHYE